MKTMPGKDIAVRKYPRKRYRDIADDGKVFILFWEGSRKNNKFLSSMEIINLNFLQWEVSDNIRFFPITVADLAAVRNQN